MQMWNEFDQGIIDASVKQWRRRLSVRVAANCGQFERSIKQSYIIICLSFTKRPLIQDDTNPVSQITV